MPRHVCAASGLEGDRLDPNIHDAGTIDRPRNAIDPWQEGFGHFQAVTLTGGLELEPPEVEERRREVSAELLARLREIGFEAARDDPDLTVVVERDIDMVA